jgi:hypothetical protein
MDKRMGSGQHYPPGTQEKYMYFSLKNHVRQNVKE